MPGPPTGAAVLLPIETTDQENNKTTVRYDARGLAYEVQVPHTTSDGEIEPFPSSV